MRNALYWNKVIGKTVLHEMTCGHYKKHLGKWEDTPNGGWYEDLSYEEAEEIQNNFQQKHPTWKHYSCAHCSSTPTTIHQVLEFLKRNLGKSFRSPREEFARGTRKVLTFTIETVDEKKEKFAIKFETGTVLHLEFWRLQLALNVLDYKPLIPIGGSLINPPRDSLEFILQEEEKELYGRQVGTKTAPHVADILTLAGLTELALVKSESGRTVQGLKQKNFIIDSPRPIYKEGKKRPFIWEMIKDAILGLNGKARYSDIRKYIGDKFGDVNKSSINAHLTLCAVNNSSRVHYPQNKKSRVATGKYDFLFKVGRGVVELYNREKHGLWEIREDQLGNLIVAQRQPEKITQPQVPHRKRSVTVTKTPLKKLIIAPCTEKKIWDDPGFFNVSKSVPAREAYIGRYGRACIEYAEVQERLGHRFLILSTKYGFLLPDDRISNYEAKDFIISDFELSKQVAKIEFDDITEIEVMASRRYYLKVKYLFSDKDLPISHPLDGLRIGESLSKLIRLKKELEATIIPQEGEKKYVEFAPPVASPLQENSEIERRSFHCQLDGEAHPAVDSAYECEECKRFVCSDCFKQVVSSGLTTCPYCQGNLRKIQ